MITHKHELTKVQERRTNTNWNSCHRKQRHEVSPLKQSGHKAQAKQHRRICTAPYKVNEGRLRVAVAHRRQRLASTSPGGKKAHTGQFTQTKDCSNAPLRTHTGFMQVGNCRIHIWQAARAGTHQAGCRSSIQNLSASPCTEQTEAIGFSTTRHFVFFT